MNFLQGGGAKILKLRHCCVLITYTYEHCPQYTTVHLLLCTEQPINNKTESDKEGIKLNTLSKNTISKVYTVVAAEVTQTDR